MVGIAVIVIALVAAYFAVFHKANQPLSQNELKIGNSVFAVERATTMAQQARGLSFRPNLAPGTGMLFLFSRPAVQSFWMKDMQFPIDIIWIAGNKVVGFAQNAAPQPGVALWSLQIYTSPDGTDKVLEVNAGTVAKDNIAVGDIITLQL